MLADEMPASNDLSETLAVNVAATPHQASALALLFSKLAFGQQYAESTLTACRKGELSLEHLLTAHRGADLVGAVWANPLAGRTAAVWPARVVEGETSDVASRLHQRLDQQLKQSGTVRLAQAMLHFDATEEATWLRERGFQHAADVLCLVSSAADFPRHGPPQHLQFTAYQPQHRQRMADLIEQTYQGTLDCPALNGVRDAEDVLQGYLETGDSGTTGWWFVRYGNQDVGCLLTADHAAVQQWELVYMGVAPSWRGRGWGAIITRYAQWRCGQAGRRRMVLAVDVANQPARVAYQRAGFECWDRRCVYLKQY